MYDNPDEDNGDDNIAHPSEWDEDWLTMVENGFVGYEKAQVNHIEHRPSLQELQDKPWYQDTYDYLSTDAGMLDD